MNRSKNKNLFKNPAGSGPDWMKTQKIPPAQDRQAVCCKARITSRRSYARTSG